MTDHFGNTTKMIKTHALYKHWNISAIHTRPIQSNDSNTQILWSFYLTTGGVVGSCTKHAVFELADNTQHQAKSVRCLQSPIVYTNNQLRRVNLQFIPFTLTHTSGGNIGKIFRNIPATQSSAILIVATLQLHSYTAQCSRQGERGHNFHVI